MYKKRFEKRCIKPIYVKISAIFLNIKSFKRKWLHVFFPLIFIFKEELYLIFGINLVLKTENLMNLL